MRFLSGELKITTNGTSIGIAGTKQPMNKPMNKVPTTTALL